MHNTLMLRKIPQPRDFIIWTWVNNENNKRPVSNRCFLSICSYTKHKMHLFSVLPCSPQQNEKWFKTFEEAAFYARDIHLTVNRFVHIHRDGNRIHWMRVWRLNGWEFKEIHIHEALIQNQPFMSTRHWQQQYILKTHQHPGQVIVTTILISAAIIGYCVAMKPLILPSD